MYVWNHDMEAAFQIAMEYLEGTGDAPVLIEAQSTVSGAVVSAWKAGMRHRIKLPNAAIKAVEREREEWPLRHQGRVTMEYQGIRYNIIQGIERRTWSWSVSIEGMSLAGQAETKSDAIAAAERAIDRAIKAKRVRPVPPEKPSHDDRSS